MATLYSFTSTGTNANFNDANFSPQNFCWTFSPSTSGTPNQLVLRVNTVTGTPTGDFYIRNQNTASGATTYGSATGVTLTAGTNTITLTGGAQITAGGTYYCWFSRTSNSSNFPNIYANNSSPAYNIYRAVGTSDPNSLWFAGDISFDVNGTTGPAIIILRG